jgi:hypothetical protein
MKRLLLLTAFLASACLSYSQIVMVGPMLHFQFGKERPRTSFAIEASYWNVQGFPYGFDAAIEFGQGKIRLYSEAQTGIGVAGISAGPFFEFGKGPARAGLQFTGWANYYIGADFRMRFYNGPDTKAVGIYGKLPAWIGEELKDDDDGGDFDGDWD